jgi:hypothetical protein
MRLNQPVKLWLVPPSCDVVNSGLQIANIFLVRRIAGYSSANSQRSTHNGDAFQFGETTREKETIHRALMRVLNICHLSEPIGPASGRPDN